MISSRCARHGVSAACCAAQREGLRPPNPAPAMDALVAKSGWKRDAMPECPLYNRSSICATCIRQGFDLRMLFCPYH